VHEITNPRSCYQNRESVTSIVTPGVSKTFFIMYNSLRGKHMGKIGGTLEANPELLPGSRSLSPIRSKIETDGHLQNSG
jgi:hypothetical protein